MSLPVQQATLLELFVEEADWLGLFDKLEVWRSRQTEGGPYEPLTADTWEPARVPPEAAGRALYPGDGPSAYLVGKELQLQIDGKFDLSITFTGTDPLTWAEAATQITNNSQGLVQAFLTAFGAVGWLTIETVGPGLRKTLRVVGGDAAPLIGLPVDESDPLATGKDARIPLLSGRRRYFFTDPNGAPEYFYKTRFFATSTQQGSALSTSFRAPAIARLSPEALVRGTVSLVDGAGSPIANRAVLVHIGIQGKQVEGRVVAGGQIMARTDVNGRTSFMLVRGTSVTVSVAGTDLARSVEVPVDAAIETFDLLDPALGKDDLFNVQRPDIPFAVRRSL